MPTIHIRSGGGTQRGKAVLKQGPLVPQQQSECEVAANKAKAAHPDMDPFKFMDRFGVFYFGPADRAPPPEPPFSYRDPKSRITFYVESDGRHLAATDESGKLLWVRNPFVDSNMCPYRSAHPYIIELRAADPISRNPDVDAGIREELKGEFQRGRKGVLPQSDDRFISLRFGSSNFGYVNIRNGDYYDMGQN
jgi:hypothetical protein